MTNWLAGCPGERQGGHGCEEPDSEADLVAIGDSLYRKEKGRRVVFDSENFSQRGWCAQ